MARQIFENNVSLTLGAAVAPTDTTITLSAGEGTKLPTIAATDEFFMGTLTDYLGRVEIVRVISFSGDVITVQRGQENTTAQAWNADDLFDIRVTRDTLYRLQDTVDTIAELRTLSKYAQDKVVVMGYHTVGDLGGGPFYLDVNDTTSADNGGTIIVANDGGRWKRIFDGGYSVEQWGAYADGIHDDTAAIQAAIDDLPANGGIVRFARNSGVYLITQTLTIGNGSDSGHSTKNGIALLGLGDGNGAGESLYPQAATQLLWGGAANSVMLRFNGPVSGCRVENMWFKCGATLPPGGDPPGSTNAQTAISVHHAYHSVFRNLLLSDFLSPGPAFLMRGPNTLPPSVIRGCDDNLIEMVHTIDPGNTAVAFDIGSDNAPAPDANGVPPIGCSRNVFLNCDIVGGTTPQAALILRYCDNITFQECRITTIHNPQFSGTALAIIISPNENHFPLEVTFYNCARIGEVYIDPAWAPVASSAAGINFLPAPYGDDTINNKIAHDGFFGMMQTRARFKQAGVRTALTSAKTIPSTTEVALAWDQVEFDTDGFWDAADPTHLTIPTTGMYQVNCEIGWTASSDTNARYIKIIQNDSIAWDYDSGIMLNDGAPVVTKTGSLLYLNKGDTICVHVYNASASSVTISSLAGWSRDNYISMHLVGV